MKTRKLWIWSVAMALLMIVCMMGAACAEYGRVHTPGGPVKMRKTESNKGKLVCEVPNKAIIEADEVGEEWCHVLYNGKQGYIRTEYLRLASMNDGSGPKVMLDAETVHVGDKVTIRVEFEGAKNFQYTVQEGKSTIKGTKVDKNEVCYRPRKSGMHCITVTVWDEKGEKKTGEIFLTVEEAEKKVESKDFTVYSQKDGWWLDKKYSVSNLSDSGCAIFTLSHALQLLGYEGENIRPENLAKKYGFCLVDGGTLNETLIGRTARDFKYTTQSELIKSAGTIQTKLQNGAVFTFAIVRGHIACVAGLSEDGTKVKIVDSAPSCTLERIDGGKLYQELESGGFAVIKDLSEVPGACYFFETDQYGGLEYYLDLTYVAKRGVRLIQPK